MTTLSTAAAPQKDGKIELNEFRVLVDASPKAIAACGEDLDKLYDYVGLSSDGHKARDSITDALYERIRTSFTVGHQTVWKTCRSMKVDLIREHVLLGCSLDPYFEVLDRLCDAVRGNAIGLEIEGDWRAAIAAACDLGVVRPWGNMNRERVYAREFEVAKAAKALSNAGLEINLAPGHISLTEDSEIKVAAALEDTIAKMGGVNAARRIFTALTPAYDEVQCRYHLVPQISGMGGGSAQVPWGYLLQLAAKHIVGVKPLDDSDGRWDHLLGLSTAYAAVIDVQPYSPMAYASFDAAGLLLFLRDLALYDTLFRIPQLRPSDVVRLAKGMFDFIDGAQSTRDGWSLDQALAVVGEVLNQPQKARGPVFLSAGDVSRALPNIPKSVVSCILDEVLCHASPGPNRNFSRPTDAPTATDPTLGMTFPFRPLLKVGSHYCLIDQSVCAPAFIEALLASLRLEHKGLDDAVGHSLERFVESELRARGIPPLSGDYDHDEEHGECDLVVETPEWLIFFELKKKALTRRARAGLDADLLLDLAGSFLQAHAQLGWHEVRLMQAGKLDLVRDGVHTSFEWNERGIAKFATSMLDYGSFQDRIVLKHFLEATMNVEFNPNDRKLQKKFNEINDSLAEIREQTSLRFPGQDKINQPFFDCWFISIPQFLVMIDGVHDTESFRSSLQSCRNLNTGCADLYYEHAYMRRLHASNALAS